MAPCPSETPILDRLQPPPAPKAPRSARALRLALGGLIGAAVAIPLTSSQALNSLSAIPLFILCFQLAVAVHEGGHLIAGWLLGFSCRGVVVCCWRVVKTVNGWRFGFEWKRIVSGGLAFVFPSSRTLKNWQYAAMIAAGPVASLLLLAMVLLAPWPQSVDAVRGPALLATLLLAVIALLPLSFGVLVSDMARLITLARGGDSWKRWKLILATATLNVQCVPPREWDPNSLAEAASLPGGRAGDRLQTILLAFLAAGDRRDYAEAAHFLEAALAISHQIGAVARLHVFLIAAAFQSYRKKDAAAGRAWFTDAGKANGVPPESVAAAEASVLFAEGRWAEAKKKASFALARVRRRAVDAATTQQAIHELQELLDEIAARASGLGAIAKSAVPAI